MNKSTMRVPDGHGFITHTAGRKNTPADEIERIINKIGFRIVMQMYIVFLEYAMLIKSQVMDKNDYGYENYPSKITLERADRPHLLA